MNEAVYRDILRRLGIEPPVPTEVARVLALPLTELDRVIEVRVPWWPLTLWFVPGEADVQALLGEGVTRGRIWTATELADLLTLGVPPAAAQTVAVVRAEFDGAITEVR
jgi:hypothetical protein